MSVGSKSLTRVIITVAAILSVIAIAVGSTLAYLWTKTPPLENSLEPVEVSCRVNETFNGDVKSNVSVTNTGDVTAYVRAAIIATWRDSDGNTYGGETPVEGVSYSVAFGSSDWVKGEDGYYYYTAPLAAGQTTSALLDTLAPISEKIPKGYTLSVRILAQAVQSEPVSAVESFWGVTVDANGNIT